LNSSPLKKALLDITHLLKIKELDLPKQAITEFEELYTRYISIGAGSLFSYTSEYPLYMFLNYLIEEKGVLIHGSNNPNIREFEPRNSSLFNGTPIKAVFASSDGVWSIFFAVLNRDGYEGSIRNLCLTVTTKRGKKHYYYFSTNSSNALNRWVNGTIYIFPKSPFKQGGIGDEWVCEDRIKPLAKISVTPNDFPFIEKVSIHKDTDSITKTILKAIVAKK
jgi:hypothetical protein